MRNFFSECSGKKFEKNDWQKLEKLASKAKNLMAVPNPVNPKYVFFSINHALKRIIRALKKVPKVCISMLLKSEKLSSTCKKSGNSWIELTITAVIRPALQSPERKLIHSKVNWNN